MSITHVWIEEGCIACGACPVVAPAVFIIPDGPASDEAIVRGSARMDGIDGPNREARSALRVEISAAESDAIHEAAEGCPVEVIRFSRIDVQLARPLECRSG
jgi:ferredoxin